MKHKLRIYDHGVVMHLKVCQTTLPNRGVIVLLLLKLNNLFRPQP